MIPNRRPEPESELPENPEIEFNELSDEAQIDAFCEELLAALTQLERSPAAWSSRARARFN
jgi:hypothetical protein